MKILEIDGNVPLSGTIRIGGAKNSAVALIPAAILTSNKTTLTNVPDITDINVLVDILEYLNVKVDTASSSIIIDPSKMENKPIPDDLSNRLRASYYFLTQSRTIWQTRQSGHVFQLIFQNLPRQRRT